MIVEEFVELLKIWLDDNELSYEDISNYRVHLSNLGSVDSVDFDIDEVNEELVIDFSVYE